ncbi:MAG TPA: polyprenyl synthetase family protein [Candidatus Alistipes excrementipullorum]|nr:polyprenyl synthetase family protein [Candidatus Alistipes excrementipullorum]
MVTINAIRKPIETELEEFDAFVRRNFSADEGLVAEMLEYVLSSRGKGIRPIVVMLSAAMNSDRDGRFGKRSYLAAMLVEMIHVASLIHDDVIDESDMRRGRASVNARWQSSNAVVIGDYILARNMDIGLSSGQYDIVSHVIKSIATLCEGELIQNDHATKLDTSRDTYFDIIHKKTASLLGVSASVGALSVGAAHDRIAAMRKFGEAVGMAFQIRDDILDYTCSAATGKPSNNDLRERKITLPLIEVLERVGEGRRREIIDALGRCSHDEASIEFITRAVGEYDGIALAQQTMKSYLQMALAVLYEYPDSPYREALMNLCAYVAERER